MILSFSAEFVLARLLPCKLFVESKEFLRKLNHRVRAYLNAELHALSAENRFWIEDGAHLAEAFQERKTFWNKLTQSSKEVAYLQAYSVQRLEPTRKATLQIEQVEKDGVQVYLSRRSPESLLVKYMIVGPSLASDVGQELYSALFTVFFDQTQIALDPVKTDGSSETIKLSDLSQETNDQARQSLREQEVDRGPLYLFSAQVSVWSGRVLSQDQRVLKREISVQSTQHKTGGLKS